MSAQVVLQVSNDVFSQATRVAAHSHRRPEELMADWLERAVAELPVELLSHDEVLSLTELQLSEQQQTHLSELLERNRESSLNVSERRSLDGLMRDYERGLLRKSQALREAVDRGLLEPLSS